jgi:hypothetical protein
MITSKAVAVKESIKGRMREDRGKGRGKNE